MLRKDFYLLGFLWLLVLIIFLPLFYNHYIFMDEALQIWGYNSIPGYYMLIDEGRWLTEVLQKWLFKFTDTVRDVTFIRLISLLGWMLCLPIWYAVIKRLVAKVSAYEYLPFFFCVYLVTSLPFIVSVQWATCMQFFIADTAALLSGAVVLNGIRWQNRKFQMQVPAALISLALGVISLFFYQGAFACFLIPFLLYFINQANSNKDAALIAGLVFYFVINGVWFVLYKLSFSFMMALNLCVFIVCLEMAIWYIGNKRVLQIAGIAMICFFAVCARYNFQHVFLKPIIDETAALKSYFKHHFNSGIQTIHFIRPSEDFMAEKYGVNRSMDEFGVSSSCWGWVPDPISRQFIYEATGDRKEAARVVVKQWASKTAYLKAGEALNSSVLLVDVPAIMNAVKP